MKETLHEPPTHGGYDAPAWTPALVKQYLADTFDVEYSRPSCRRLLKEAGLRYQKPPRRAAEAEVEDREAFKGERTKRAGRWTPR